LYRFTQRTQGYSINKDGPAGEKGNNALKMPKQA
jgi:hypothetical protein